MFVKSERKNSVPQTLPSEYRLNLTNYDPLSSLQSCALYPKYFFYLLCLEFLNSDLVVYFVGVIW